MLVHGSRYTNFLRLAQPDYLQVRGDDGSMGLADEAWHEECANLGASEPTESAALGFNAEAFARLYTYFGRSVMLDYENVSPPDVAAAAVMESDQAETEAASAAAKASESSGSGATKLQRLGKTLDDIETSAASATAAAARNGVLQTGRDLRAAMEGLLATQPEVERAYRRAGGGGAGDAIYGERAAAEALALHARLLSLLESVGEQIEQDSVAFAAAEAAEAEATAKAVAAAAAAEEAERQRAERAAATLAQEEQRQAAEEDALLAAVEAQKKEEEEATRRRAEQARRARGQAPIGQGDQFRKSKWKSWPLGQDPELPLDMDLAIKLQADCEAQMEALHAALARMGEANVPREQKRKCLGVLVMFCENLLREPRSRNFRKVRMRNERFAADVLSVDGARNALEALGFEEEEWWGGMAGVAQGEEEEEGEAMEGERFLILNEVNLDNIAEARRVLEDVRSRT